MSRSHVCVVPTAISPSVCSPHSAVLQKETNVCRAEKESPDSLSSFEVLTTLFSQTDQTLRSCFPVAVKQNGFIHQRSPSQHLNDYHLCERSETCSFTRSKMRQKVPKTVRVWRPNPSSNSSFNEPELSSNRSHRMQVFKDLIKAKKREIQSLLCWHYFL